MQHSHSGECVRKWRRNSLALFPRDAYHAETGFTPTSISSAVVTPSRACNVIPESAVQWRSIKPAVTPAPLHHDGAPSSADSRQRQFPRIPTLRTASRFVSGSITRPLATQYRKSAPLANCKRNENEESHSLNSTRTVARALVRAAFTLL